MTATAKIASFRLCECFAASASLSEKDEGRPMGSSEEEAVSAANSFPRDSSDPVTPSSMRFEGQRLRTFSDWPADAPVEARKVARAGFFR